MSWRGSDSCRWTSVDQVRGSPSAPEAPRTSMCEGGSEGCGVSAHGSWLCLGAVTWGRGSAAEPCPPRTPQDRACPPRTVLPLSPCCSEPGFYTSPAHYGTSCMVTEGGGCHGNSLPIPHPLPATGQPQGIGGRRAPSLPGSATGALPSGPKAAPQTASPPSCS